MEKFTMKTPDGIAANIDALKRLFPEAVTEGKIDLDQLKTLLGEEVAGDERYQFTWAGKRAAMLEASAPTTKTLRPCVAESKDWETTKNIYIEGDNLEALKILQNTYGGKVKMIYIDPPYNTGHDFIYHDNFHGTKQEELIKEGAVDAETGERFKVNADSNGYFHSDWCSMMYPRLKLARNLLREDGVLFMSIDDNEVVNARKLCDEVFGEKNVVALITVIVKTEGRQYGHFAKTHEYLLVCAKDAERVVLNEIQDVSAEFRYKDERGGFNTIGLRNRAVRIFNSTNRPNLRYPFYVDISDVDANGFMPVYTECGDHRVEVWPSVVDGLESVWRWGKETASRQRGELVATKGNDGVIRVFKKDRELTSLPKTMWSKKEFNSIYGTREVASLIGAGMFDFSKPSALMRQIAVIGTDADSIVLDFFSGSATTAHAVMQLNAEDGGQRRFILVQLPEVCADDSEAAKAGYKNICEIGKERIRRAGEKIRGKLAAKNSHGDTEARSGDDLFNQKSAKSADSAQKNLRVSVPPCEKDGALGDRALDVGFRVFKVDSSNMDDIYFQPKEIQQQDLLRAINNVKTDRNALDLLFGCLLEWGLPIDLPIKARTDLGNDTYDVDDGRIIACFDTNVGDGIVKTIAKEQPDFAIFRDLSFVNSAAKINVGEIFKALSPKTQIKVL